MAAKELRYLARHPRLRVAWMMSCLLGLALVVFVSLTEGLQHPWMVLASLAMAFLASQNSLNQFGFDGPAYWTQVAAGADPRGDLVGRNLASMVTGTLTTAVLALVLALVTGGWLYVPVALCLGVGVLALSLGVADVISVRFAYPLPDDASNLWAVQGTGQGCLVGVVQMVAFAAQGVLLLPLVALVVVGLVLWPPALVLVCPLAIVYGGWLWRVGLGLGADWLDRPPARAAGRAQRPPGRLTPSGPLPGPAGGGGYCSNRSISGQEGDRRCRQRPRPPPRANRPDPPPAPPASTRPTTSWSSAGAAPGCPRRCSPAGWATACSCSRRRRGSAGPPPRPPSGTGCPTTSRCASSGWTTPRTTACATWPGWPGRSATTPPRPASG